MCFPFVLGQRVRDRRQQNGQPAHGQRPELRVLGSILSVQTGPLGNAQGLSGGQAQSNATRLSAAAQGPAVGRGRVPPSSNAERNHQRGRV